MCFVVRARDFVQDNDGDANQGADADQTPIDVRGDDALRERGDEAGLRRRQWIWTQFSARCADEPIGLIHEIEHRRNDQRAREDTEDERDLLLPRSRINQLTSLQVLQIVVRNRGDVENDRGGEKREGDE